MRKYILTLIASTVILASGSVAANAQQGPAGPTMQQGAIMGPGMIGPMMMGSGMMGIGMMGPNTMRMMVIMMDADGDGALSQDEFLAVHERMFTTLDADDDGRLTPEEAQMFMLPTPNQQ